MQSPDHDDPRIYEFGWWPEIVGALGVAALAAFLITFATGIM